MRVTIRLSGLDSSLASACRVAKKKPSFDPPARFSVFAVLEAIFVDAYVQAVDLQVRAGSGEFVDDGFAMEFGVGDEVRNGV